MRGPWTVVPGTEGSHTVNPDGSLTPGLFARVRLLGTREYAVLLIHDMAVLTDQDRKYVYVVGANNLAERRGPPGPR